MVFHRAHWSLQGCIINIVLSPSLSLSSFSCLVAQTYTGSTASKAPYTHAYSRIHMIKALHTHTRARIQNTHTHTHTHRYTHPCSIVCASVRYEGILTAIFARSVINVPLWVLFAKPLHYIKQNHTLVR